MTKESNWYSTITESGIIILLISLIFFPLGLLLIWRNRKWSPTVKLLLMIALGGYLFSIKSPALLRTIQRESIPETSEIPKNSSDKVRELAPETPEISKNSSNKVGRSLCIKNFNEQFQGIAYAQLEDSKQTFSIKFTSAVSNRELQEVGNNFADGIFGSCNFITTIKISNGDSVFTKQR